MKKLFHTSKIIYLIPFWGNKPKYKSIHDLPVGIFNKILSTNNLHLLGNLKPEKLIETWENIYSQYIDEFGANEDYISYLRKMQKVALIYEKIYVHGKRHLKPIAEIKAHEAREGFKIDSGMKFSSLVAHVSKAMGFQIDVSKTSVFQFYGYLKIIKNG